MSVITWVSDYTEEQMLQFLLMHGAPTPPTIIHKSSYSSEKLKARIDFVLSAHQFCEAATIDYADFIGEFTRWFELQQKLHRCVTHQKRIQT